MKRNMTIEEAQTAEFLADDVLTDCSIQEIVNTLIIKMEDYFDFTEDSRLQEMIKMLGTFNEALDEIDKENL